MDFKSKFRTMRKVDEHERYSELCALFTAGNLTDDEQAELKLHLHDCPTCMETLHAYRGIAKSVMPVVMPVGQAKPPQELKSWSVENAKKQLLNRIEVERAKERPHVVTAAAQVPGWWWEAFVRERVWLGTVAAVALLSVLVAFIYRMGELRGIKAAHNTSSTALPQIQQKPIQVGADQRLLGQQMARQSQEVARLEQELKKKIAEARALHGKLLQDTQTHDSTMAALGSDKDNLAAERDALTRKLQEAQSSLASAQQRLAALQEEHTRQSLHTASLEQRVNELSAETMKDQEVSRPSHEAALYADSDVRELMGARELYIADVFDVDRDGKPQKAFGRVFYTGGKSLIFYAFDLDRQPGVREASTFQAWGRRGPGDKHPLSMGNFKLDNVANRRWVLRFDNPKMLAQLDAVFVTVESRSGGQKPTGKQLLFASLRIPPNHP
ncbi:MAG: hypothetical protein JWM83_1912 [Candidatus Angelobacter sp.]|nr:hypothetical protein [Candidatus Angelobacter sp.]